jgi:hypothetical protein
MNMIKTRIDQEELWPVYIINDMWGVEVGLPQELIDRYQAATKEFHEVQELLEEVYEAAQKGK